MSDSVKPRRSYRSTLRVAQAEQTRQHVLTAARDQFASQGWTKTTIAAIARAAGVSAETIYAGFGSKAALLEQLVQDAVRGTSPGVPLMQQSGPQAVLAEADARRKLQLFATSITAVLGRVAPLVAVARAAAETDPELRALYLALHDGRRRNLGLFVATLAQDGDLRPGLTPEAALDQVFRIASPEMFLLLRDVEGCEPEIIARWIESTLEPMLSPVSGGGAPALTNS